MVLVTGTGTEIGKTHAAVRLARHLRAANDSVRIGARKPAQSFEPGEGPTDAERLADATGEPASAVCPPERSYPVPMAPPMAADALGLPVPTIAGLAGWIEASWPAPALDLGLVECAGGVASPQAGDGDCRDLATAVAPDDVVLVADARLGTINLVTLSTEALAAWPVVVFLNRFSPTDDLQARNLAWLRTHLRVPIVTTIADLAALVTGPSR